MRWFARAMGPAALVAGATLVGYAVASGGAHVYLLLVLPVIRGTTAPFFLGVLLVVVGIFLLPMALLRGAEEEGAEAAPPAAAPPSSGGSGGLVLVGPIPIFFGAWRRNPPISYGWALMLGAVLVAATLLLLWGLAIL